MCHRPHCGLSWQGHVGTACGDPSRSGKSRPPAWESTRKGSRCVRLGGARRQRPRGGGGAVGTGGKRPPRVLLVGRAALGRLTALLVFCRWRSRGTEKSSDFAAGTSWGGPGLELGEHPDSGPGPACGVTPPPLLGAKTSCKVKRAARRGGSSPRGLACPLRDAGPAAPRALTQATCPVRWADGPVLGSTGTEPLSPALLQLLPAPGLRAGLGGAAPRRGSLTAPASPPGHRSKVPPAAVSPRSRPSVRRGVEPTVQWVKLARVGPSGRARLRPPLPWGQTAFAVPLQHPGVATCCSCLPLQPFRNFFPVASRAARWMALPLWGVPVQLRL